MNTSIKPSADEKFPSLSWQQSDGTRLAPAEMSGWRMRVVYRGAHCPLCKSYLKTLEELQSAYRDAGIAVAVTSSYPEDRARAEAADEKWIFPVGFGMGPEEMRRLGLYVSVPRSTQETDREFAEPAVIV